MTSDPEFIEPEEYEQHEDEYEVVGVNYSKDGELRGYYVKENE